MFLNKISNIFYVPDTKFVSATMCPRLLSFTLFITVKAITKLNLGQRNNFEIEFQKISRRSSHSSNNAELVISRCCFAEDGKEMYKDL